ncbi:MAG: glycosyltransferase [Calditrichaeota bacterium]|nr:glycosyltransferase [Calditrichota bacterium]
MPEVSVIIPTFNRAAWIANAVDSVLKQTFRDFELLVVDDGSTDDTLEILERFGSSITFVAQPNRGVSSARNTGIGLASGKYLCFLDSDDLWKPRKLEIQLAAMSHYSEYKISYTDEIWIRNGRWANPKKRHQKYSGWIFPHLLPLCLISPSSVMIERSVFDEVGLFDESLPAGEDYDLWLRIGSRYPILFIPEKVIVKHGGHPDQLSQKYWGLDRFRVRSILKVLESGKLSSENERAAREMLVKKCRILANGSAKRGKLEDAGYYQKLAETWE